MLLLWAAFFWRFAAPDSAGRWALADGDFTQQFGVFRDLVYRAIAAGRAPLWADCLLSGYPLHADPQMQLFYFPSWIAYAVLRLGGWGHYPIGALTAEGLAHYLLVSLLLYAFLRGEVRRPAAALFGAVVFTYSGYLTGFPVLQIATIETLAWLPLALLCLRRLADPRSARRPAYLAGAALALAVAYFGGHPQTFVYVSAVALAYLGFRLRLAGQPWRAWLGWGAGLVILTTGLAAVQLAPSVQFITLSTRASIPFEEAARGLQYRDVAGFFLTGLVSHWNYLYIGLLPLAVAAVAILRAFPVSPDNLPNGHSERRSREESRGGRETLHALRAFSVTSGRIWKGSVAVAARFWGVVALAGLLLSFGSRGGLYNVLYWLLPPFRLFRGQEHWTLVVAFALSVLAALGADLWLGPLARRARRALRGLGWGSLVLFLASLGVFAAVLVYAPAGPLPQRAALLVLFALLALLVVRARLAWPAARRWQGALLLAVAALDLFAVNRGQNASPPFEAYPYTPLLDPVRAEGGFFRVQDDFQLPGHAGCGYGFKQVEGITPYRLATYQAFLDRAPEPARWQLLGVRYVVTWRQGLESESPLPVEAAAQAPSAPGAPNDAGITKVFRIQAPEPRRAFLVYTARSFSNDDALYAALNDPAFDPFSTALTLDPITLPGGPAARPGDVRVTADEPGRVTLSVEAARPGLVILSEAWYPGWTARLDGVPVRALRVDGALLAAEAPPGQHTLTFEFHSPALVWGGAISILSAVIVALLTSGVTPHASRLPHYELPITDYALRFTPHTSRLALPLLLLASLLRLYRLGAAPLRGDEAFAVTFAAFPLPQMFAGMAQAEPNPPLYWLLVRGWMRLAGDSELAVRLPSALAGLVVVALTYRLARALLPPGVRRPGAQIAAFLAAVNPFLIWHAQDARVYSLLVALVTAAAWLTLRAARRGPAARAYLPAAALWWLALMAHYFALFALAAVCVAALASPALRRRWQPALVALAALALAYLPWALYAGPLLLSHTKDWIKPISLAAGFERTLVAFTGGLLLDQPQAAVAALAGGALAVLGTAWLVRPSHLPPLSSHFSPPTSHLSLPILAWFPPLLLGLLSLWRPAFDERFVITALPAVLILMAVPIARWWRGPTLLAGLLVVVLAGLALRSLGNYYFNPAFAKSPDWRGLAAYLGDEASPQDVILQNFEDPAFAYYYRGPTPVQDSPPDSSADQQTRLAALLDAHPRLWFFLSDATTAGADWLDGHAERLSDGRVYGFRLQVFDSPAGSLAAMLPFEGRFSDGVRLAGYRLYPSPYRLHPAPDGESVYGGPLHLTLYWQADGNVSQDYTVFTHFVAADGFRVTGHDGPPAHGRRPTTGWGPGETIVDPHDLAIPADLAPGEYFIRVGLYDPVTGRRLSMVDSADDFLTLPVSVEVASP